MNPPLLSSGWRGGGTRPVRQLRSKNVGLRILNLLAVQKSLDEFFCTLMAPEGRQTGLLTDSIVMTDNIATIALSEIDRAIGRMPMSGVDAALRHTLGL